MLPLVEGVARMTGTGIPGAGPFVQHLTLWVAFLGAILAAREKKLLSLATGELVREGRIRAVASSVASAVGAGASALLARASWDMVLLEKEFGTEVAAGLPTWIAQLVLPVAFAVIAIRLALGTKGWRQAPWSWGGLLAGVALGQFPGLVEGLGAWPIVLVLGAAALLGTPIFAVLGGAAVLLFLSDGIPAAAVPAETYRMAVSPTLPAIPLFTLAGFLLARGDASERLHSLFRAWVGWLPGGTAVVAALLCAFFTVFTGGSGVTILALGALLYQALRSEGYRDRFSVGLLTGAGSLGLLFPPALPLILYGIVASVPIEDLFKGGLLPGILLIALVAGWGIWEGRRLDRKRRPFELGNAFRAMRDALPELLIPVVALGAIFGGFATLVEAAAVTAFYCLVVEVVIRRSLPARQLGSVLIECSVLLGGVLVILAVAMGLTSYLVDAQAPAKLLEWVQGSIESKWAFLLALNLFLLVVGCLMDIFSAIVVVVPLILPLGLAFGVDPIHLGILFIANLELGYLTPPVGLNLFLSAYRFDKPLLEVWRAAIPVLVILAIGVLLITYVPAMTTAFL